MLVIILLLRLHLLWMQLLTVWWQTPAPMLAGRAEGGALPGATGLLPPCELQKLFCGGPNVWGEEPCLERPDARL